MHPEMQPHLLHSENTLLTAGNIAGYRSPDIQWTCKACTQTHTHGARVNIHITCFNIAMCLELYCHLTILSSLATLNLSTVSINSIGVVLSTLILFVTDTITHPLISMLSSSRR